MGRKFRHKDGFADDTDYLEILESGDCVLHYKDGSAKAANYWSLSGCLHCVKNGIWVELNQSIIKRIGQFFRRICSGKR